MKKYFPYFIAAVLVTLLIVIVASSSTKPRRKMDERITLRQADKIPYGTRVAKELLASLYPNASIAFDRKYPGAWDSIEVSESNQAVILMADYFDADDEELQELAGFVKRGNYVVMIGRAVSDEVAAFFNFSYKNDYYSSLSTADSLKMRLEPPAFANDSSFTYPGLRYDGSFNNIKTGKAVVLGRNEKGEPNFIQYNKGKGSFYIHSAPLAFSNFFILHKSNVSYYEQALSVLPANIATIVWNEYFLEKPRKPEENKEPNWMSALLSYPEFKWGLLIGFFTLALFILLGMRRKQRMIPPVERPKNDSLDFVKTLGRLYYDRKDHNNLANKMAAYFLEHVRSKYKLPTHTLDEGFILALHFKSGYPETETRNIVTAVAEIRKAAVINEEQLSQFYKQLELFYQNT